MRWVLIASMGLVAAVAFLGCAPLHQGNAQSALAAGRLDDAASEIQAALASDPDNGQIKSLAAQIFTQRGVKYYKNGEMIAAQDDFHRAVDYDPFYGQAYDYLGLIAFSQHDWQNAINYGSKAAGLQGKPNPMYVQQAQAELRKVRSGGLETGHRQRSTQRTSSRTPASIE
jgi:tetratricopeptide (TPR) repeat protein